MAFLIVIFVLAFVKFTCNYFRARKVRRLFSQYENYILEKPDWSFHKNKSEIIALFKEADLQDVAIQVESAVSNGGITISQVSLFENMLKFELTIINNIHSCFLQAIGVFELRMKNSYSILYWGKEIFFAPQRIIKYIGFSEESKLAKLLNVIWWGSTVMLYIILNYYHIGAINVSLIGKWSI
jgi:hypothetical protein